MADSVRSMLTAYTTAQWTANCLSHSRSHRSDSQIFVENRDLCLPHLHSTPLSGEYSHNVWYGKTRMVWLPDHEKNFQDMFIHFDRIHERQSRYKIHDERNAFNAAVSLTSDQPTDRQTEQEQGWLVGV